jgi:hypothetical protein
MAGSAPFLVAESFRYGWPDKNVTGGRMAPFFAPKRLFIGLGTSMENYESTNKKSKDQAFNLHFLDYKNTGRALNI